MYYQNMRENEGNLLNLCMPAFFSSLEWGESGSVPGCGVSDHHDASISHSLCRGWPVLCAQAVSSGNS